MEREAVTIRFAADLLAQANKLKFVARILSKKTLRTSALTFALLCVKKRARSYVKFKQCCKFPTK